jgi:hypothetical protein
MCEIHATSLAPPLAKVQSFFNPAFARRNHPPPDESAVGIKLRLIHLVLGMELRGRG